MQNYELLCILPGTLTEEEIKPVIENVKEMMTKSNIENVVVKDMGKSRLAYPVKHIRYGYFQLLQFETERSNIAPLRKRLKGVSELLRAVITKFDPVARTESEKRTGAPKTSMETLSKIDRDVPRQTGSGNKKREKTSASASKKEVEKIDLKEIDENLDKILESDLEKV
jgi:small subunit ribosomal protein S6